MKTYVIIGIILVLAAAAFFMNVATENICKGLIGLVVVGYCFFYMSKGGSDDDIMKAQLSTDIMPNPKPKGKKKKSKPTQKF